MKIAPPPVLYAEDTEDDVFLMRRAFARAAIDNPLLVAGNGREAIAQLESLLAANAGPARPPCLVMLDVKMPFLGGMEILKWIRQHEEFKHVPVIIFSSSSQTRDITDARRLGANAYLVKPSNLDDLRTFVEALRPICAGPPVATDWLKVPGSVL